MQLKRRYRQLVWLALATAVVIAAGIWIGYRSTALNGPMVQQLRPDQFLVVWAGASGNSAKIKVTTPDGKPVHTKEVQPQDRRYKAVIQNLQPGLRYGYEVSADEGKEALATGSARTDPGLKGSFRFLAFGDSGDGSRTQYRLAELMPEYAPDLVIHTGDLVFPDGAAEDYPEKFYRPYSELLARAAFYPCAGNHDYNDYEAGPMAEAFVLPRNGPEGSPPAMHYWFDYGKARFVCINSNVGFSEMKQQVVPWLDKVLADAGERWKIAFYHHPPYTGGKYAPSGKVRQLLVPLFDRYGVHLAFNGHNHMYERTHPLRGGQIRPTSQGTIYITTGAGGNPLYDVEHPNREYLRVQDNTQHSFTIVDVSPEKILIRQVGIDDQVIDTFALKTTVSEKQSRTRPARTSESRPVDSASNSGS